MCISTDVDECDNGTVNCDTNANCMNTNGSFICVCISGWSGDGVVCEGIDLSWCGISLSRKNLIKMFTTLLI